MAQTIQIKLTNKACQAGLLYAQKHLTTPPKDAVISCEGICLKGETARRAANLIAHRLAPEVCKMNMTFLAAGRRQVHAVDDRKATKAAFQVQTIMNGEVFTMLSKIGFA